MSNVSLLTNGVGDINGGGLLMPTGTILAFAGTSAPSGWLLCDGTAYNQTDYAALFSVLSSTYNTQVNPTTGASWAAPSAGQFRVPDYRGVFLRSSGTASGQSPVTVGGYQGQATAKNGLSISDPGHTHPIVNRLYVPTGAGNNGGAGVDVAGGGASFSATSSNTAGISLGNGDTETRPLNKGVMYIIKI